MVQSTTSYTCSNRDFYFTGQDKVVKDDGGLTFHVEKTEAPAPGSGGKKKKNKKKLLFTTTMTRGK